MTVQILDCTLRDGTYVNDGAFGFSAIKNIVSNLNDSKLDIIECGWLFDDVEYSKDKTYFPTINDTEWILPENKKSELSLMLYHDKYKLKKIPQNTGKIDIIREIFHKDKFKEAVLNSEIIKDSGYKLFYQVVNTGEYNNRDLMELSGLANKTCPDCLYIVDTHGGMFREDLKRTFDILSENLDDSIKIGFHSHNNLQLSFSLSIDFINFANAKKRDVVIDSTLFGLGRGAGNLNTELILEYLNKFYFKNYELDKVNKLITDEILKLKNLSDWGYSIPYLMTGSYNIHSRYAKYLTEKYNTSPEDLREILVDLTLKNKKDFSINMAESEYSSLDKK